ncbi:hypothetical protein CLM62_12585 [Streptomyces sp. SA15]|uniref:hypothetical protein n=1 Tax=Streptomyces sp. SA15 TaxID=934019 RepID=UPI000BAFC09F|nr:hypothetical protein [Streptomyces sp. SA15]PAZ15626.1 hypothetical protein CLM62_12585 [Streptomyces sp. SA15]
MTRQQPLTDEQLNAIDARSNAATKGPWTAWAETYPHLVLQGPKGVHPSDAEGIVSTNLAVNEGVDAEFIAHAREDVPALLDEVRRLRAELARRVQCNDCGAVGEIFTGDDGHAYLDPSGQIGHRSASAVGGQALTAFFAAQQDGGEMAERLTGTRPCGHDDYHDPHEWAERPGVWCPGHSCDEPATASGPQVAASEETNR